MERGLYIAASGMLAEMARQDQLANDLANASTPGYKADRVSQRSFGDLMLSNSADGSTVGPLGQGAAIDKQETDLRPQALRETGQPLDLAIAGDGYFGVQTAQGVRYTRNGSFTADAKGNLVDQLGNQVLGVGGKPVTVDRRHDRPDQGRALQPAQPGQAGRLELHRPGRRPGHRHGQVRLAGGLGRRPGPRDGRPHGLHALHGGHASARSRRSTDAAADRLAGRRTSRAEPVERPG